MKSLFSRKEKTQPKPEYDKENEVPILRCSICNGEQVAGFKDRRSGHFREYSVIRSRESRRKSEMAEAENRAKQEEMERRLALKEQLLEQERQRKEQDGLINALASDYHAIFYIDLDRDSGICYQGKDGMSSLKTGERFVYSEASERYARRHVKEEDQQAFLDFIRIDNLRARLEKETVISHRFIIRVQDREVYEILRYAGI